MTETPFFKPRVSWGTILATATLAIATSSATTTAIIDKFLFPQSSQQASPRKISSSNVTVDAVTASGRLEPQGEVINLFASYSREGARVDQLRVKVGDRVKAGQVVAVLDNRERLQAALEISQAQVKIAQVRLAKIRAGAKISAINAQVASIDRLKTELNGQALSQAATIGRIVAQLSNAQSECVRYQTLYQEGAIAASVRDTLCLREKTLQQQLNEAQATRSQTVETLLKQLTEAQARLNAIAEVRPVDIAIAQAELDEAKADFLQAQANLDLAYVRTPQAGQVLKIYTLAGEVVGEKGIVALGETDQMYAIAEIYETDIHQIRLRQRATITSKGFVGKLTGTVEEVDLQISKKNNLNTAPVANGDAIVAVKIRLNPASSRKVTNLTNLQVKVVIHLNSQ